MVPWKEFEETFNSIDKYHDDYSVKSGDLLGKVKTLMYNGQDAYFKATQEVSNWASLAVKMLEVYIKLFQQHNVKKAEAQKSLLLTVLNDGIEKMTTAKESLHKSSASFNGAVGELTALNMNLAAEFNSKSDFYQQKVTALRTKGYAIGACFGLIGLVTEYIVLENGVIPELTNKLNSIRIFYEDTRRNVSKAIIDIDSIKNQMAEEIHVIGQLQTQTEKTKIVVEYDLGDQEEIIQSAKRLIANCKQYQERHNVPKLILN